MKRHEDLQQDRFTHAAVRCFLGSAPFLLSRPALLLLALVPFVINIVLFYFIVYALSGLLIDPLVSRIALDSESLDTILSWITKILLFIVTIGLSGLICFLLIIPINAPFCDYISEKMERELLVDRPDLLAPEQTIIEGILHAIKDGLQRVLILLPIIIFTFLLGLIPFIGPVLTVLIGFILNATFLCLDAFSYSMDRRLTPFNEKIKWLKSHKKPCFVFGSCLAVLLLIPCNLVWLPLISAVSGTRMYCEMVLELEERRKD